MKLQGEVALVTGGGRRLGAAWVRELAELGATVAIHCHHSTAEAQALADALNQAGHHAVVFPADLRDPAAITTLARDVEATLGPVAVLVHGAASFVRRSTLKTPPELWQDTFALNLTAPALLTRALAPGLWARRGLVVLVGDLSGEQGWEPWGAHSVAKAGLLMLGRLLALEMAPEVRVNTLVPGLVLEGEAPVSPSVLARIPLGRSGHPDDTRQALRYLVEADYVTGQVLHVDGGRGARRT